MILNKHKAILSLLIPLTLSSCLKDEQPDTNADILEAYIDPEFLKSEPIITNTSVEFRVKSNVDLTKLSPIFIISPNATIDPLNGTVRDYTNAQTATVTAQDKQWKKTYTISFNVDELSTRYTFDDAELTDNDRYYRFYTIGSNGDKVYDWASGNSGYVTAAGTKPPEEYPTTIAPGRNGGNAVKMQTVYTNSLAAAVGTPIAAGNLFMGSFKTNILNTLKSTKFGLPYSGPLPRAIRTYYTYKAGAEVRDKDFNVVPGDVDSFDMYAIIFETQATNNFMYGDHNFQDARNIAVARVPASKRLESATWKELEFDFELLPGKTYDPTKEYMITIVMSSSIEGALFKGAIGSTLIVDEIEILY